MEETSLIVVLNDGETFTAIEGCEIFAVPENMDADDIEEALSEDSLTKVADLSEIAQECLK